MVDIFIVHSSTDENYIQDTVIPYLTGKKDLEGNQINGKAASKPLFLESKSFRFAGKEWNPFWKIQALRTIKQAKAVIVVLGDDTHKEKKAKTMGWEIRKARKYNKLIMVHNPGTFPIPEYMKLKDPFTKELKIADKTMSLPEIKARIDNFDSGYYEIFSKQFSCLPDEKKEERKDQLLEQYKMFQQTSEVLVERRQNVNSFYITVNSALVAIVGLILGLVSYPLNLWVIFFMCVVGIILDISWIGILNSYGSLNSAKMKLINLIEEQLPIALYDMEWKIMSDKLNSKKYTSFTDSEKRIPKLFLITYAVILVCAAVAIVKTGFPIPR